LILRLAAASSSAWSVLGPSTSPRSILSCFSQEALGLAAEIHPTWISHIESGRNNPAWGSVKRIAAALDITAAELAKRAEALDDA
jgi:transcriptional regulator with XRE-family HTH domain